MAQRIGLLTLPLHINYGGILQAAALYRHLSKGGNEVVLLNRVARVRSTPRRRKLMDAAVHLPGILHLDLMLQPRRLRDEQNKLAPATLGRRISNFVKNAAHKRRMASHQAFIQRFMPRVAGPLESSEALADAVKEFQLDSLVVGSDQVWRVDYMPDAAVQDFFLGFAPSASLRRISYAASFGHSEWKYPALKQTAADLLSRFDAVSVRESSGVDICRETLGRSDVHHVLDPTLLVDPAFYDEVAAPPSDKSGPMLLEYVLDPSPLREQVRAEVTAKLGGRHEVRSLSVETGVLTPLDVPGWVRAFMDADFVVTDSFHGMVFSIIFRKNFVALVNRDRGADRFTSLLDRIGLSHRLVLDGSVERAGELAREPIEYAPVHARIAELRASSQDFLLRALS